MTEHNEYQPGDVALMYDGLTALRTDSGWIDQEGDYRPFGYVTRDNPDVRPLVTIDPEDSGQAERLHTLWCEAIDSAATSARQIDSMQAALREFASPTPPEPAECWAVKDASGHWMVSEKSEDDGWRQVYSTGSISDEQKSWHTLRYDLEDCGGIDSGKPPEPTGLGAVVECERGMLCVRTSNPEFPWVDAANARRNSYHWTNFGGLPQEPVRVLSDGVTDDA